jgi:DNA-directed RNA polymerase beta' subunit
MVKPMNIALGALVVLGIFYMISQRSQKSHSIVGNAIYSGDSDSVFRVVLTEGEKEIELIRSDSTWKISTADTLIIKDKQIDKLFNKILTVEQEMLISSKSEKWEKFGVDDSLGRHIQVFNEENQELLHYIFGNSGSDFQHNYVREVNSSDIYRTNNNIFFLLNTDATYWGKIPPKPTIESTEN